MLRTEQLLRDLLDECEEFAAYVVDRSSVISSEAHSFLEAVRETREDLKATAQDEQRTNGIGSPSVESHQALR